MSASGGRRLCSISMLRFFEGFDFRGGTGTAPFRTGCSAEAVGEWGGGVGAGGDGEGRGVWVFEFALATGIFFADAGC